MARPEKIAAIEELKANIQGNAIAIAARYQGITVEQVTNLRAKLRAQGCTYKVYKNTLASRALDELGISEASAFMDGPTAWAFSKDAVTPAKILKDFAKEVNKIAMQGGIMDGKPLSSAQLDALAELPSRDVLLGQVVGTIAMPLRNLVGALSALPRNLVNALDQVRKQREEAA